MFTRQSQLDLFGASESPVVNVTVECACRDFVTLAKAQGLPPFALLLYGIARASMAVENFRYRLAAGEVHLVQQLTVGYTVIGADDNLNFSKFAFAEDWPLFLSRYLVDREQARSATVLRAAPLADHDYIFVTGLPWLRFMSIQHPLTQGEATCIPRFAVGQFQVAAGQVTMPLSVQAHHGFVDGLHIQRFIVRLTEIMADLVRELSHS